MIYSMRWYKKLAKLRQERCLEGQHVFTKEVRVWARYNRCERQCGTYEDNLTYDEAKAKRKAKIARAKKKAEQLAGSLVCAVQGHDMLHADPPDSWMFCKRCGEDWGPWKK